MRAARKAFGRIGRGILTAVASAVLLLWALPVSATVDLEAGTPGVAVENGTNVLIALPIENLGDTAALSVELRSVALVPTPFSITLFPAVLTSPGLPLSVGAIAPNSRAVAQLRFTVRGPIASGSFQLYGSGTYTDASNPRSAPQPFEFSISQTTPPPAPGSASLQNNNATSQVVAGGGFPHIPLPNNFAEANEAGPPVPTGPFIPVTPTKNGTAPTPDPGDPSVTFSANDPLDLLSGSFSGDASTVAEPSGGANGGGVIFATANWTAAYSTNGGGSFTQLDPTTIFPNDAVGYCCDQVVQYVPSIDRFIWLLQGNGYRIASASPAAVKSSGATAWTYWNLTPGFFGLTGSLDYPDMSVGNNYLYLSFDQVGTGLMVARISLAQIQAGGTILVEWTDPKNGGPAYGSHVMQDTANEIFWAGHNSTSQMRIFSLAEGSTTYFWRDVNIGSWSNTGLSSTTPDSNDFLTKLRDFPGNAVIGATRAPGPPSTAGQLFSDGLWFAWSAGTDRNFPQPHVEMVTLDRNNNFALVQQVQIWNSGYTFVYPALATNACTEEVGFSIEGGGSGNYENHLVGFWGDFVAYITTNSSIGTTRYGDYVTIRQDPTPGLNGAFFDAFGYGLNAPSALQTGPQTDVRYVQFGRAGACQVKPPG
jgi:hypothetical protein